MHKCERISVLAVGTALVLMLAGTALAADKATESKERAWSPLGPSVVLVDVAEVEPNNGLVHAQWLGCGNVLRPAAINVAADTDYVAFTANAGDQLTIGTDADGTTGQVNDTRIRLFNESGAVLATDDDSGPSLYSLITFTATYTGTYYVGFAAYSATTTGGYKGFVTCTPPQPPPVNDLCAGALTIECGNINLAGTTQYATNDYTPIVATGGCTGYAAEGRDVVYKLNSIIGDVLDVTYTNAVDGSIYLITDCADPIATCVAGSDATLSGAAEHLAYTITASGTYYLILDSYGTNTGGAYTLVGTYVCPTTRANHRSWGLVKSIYR